MCGSDWRSYETMYYEMSLKKPFADLLLEPGLFVLMYPFRLLGSSYWIFSIAIKLVCFVIFYRFIFKYSGRYRYLALMFFISFYGIYLLVDAPMRNLCAIAICLVGFFWMQKNRLQALLFFILAVFFHSSALLMMLVYFVINRKIKSSFYLVFYAILIIISFSFGSYMENLVNTPLGVLLADNSTQFDTYYVKGYNQAALTASPLALGELLKLIFFCWILYKRKSFENIEYGNYIFNGAMLFFLIAKLGAMSNIFVRFGCYLSPFYAIALCLVTIGVPFKFKKMYQNAIFFVAFLLCYTAVTADYRYVPYTNYITYSLTHDDIPSYTVRSNYNHVNSPYRNKQLK